MLKLAETIYKIRREKKWEKTAKSAKIEQGEIVFVSVDNLNPAEYNPRQWDEKATRDLEESIKRFGMVDPLIVNSAENRKNVVIGGHFRLFVAKRLGWKEVPVVYVNIPDLKREQELNLRLNKNTGAWDYDLLANFDENLLIDVGWTPLELNAAFHLDDKTIEDEFDAEANLAAITEPKTKLGDIYQLGQHRLMCGDATKREDVERLMNGSQADMVFTDPPYGVEYEGGSTNKKKRDDAYFDKFPDFVRFLTDALTNAYTNAKENSALYLWFASKRIREVLKALDNAGWIDRNLIFWLKLKAHYGHLGAQYKQRHEPMFYAVKGMPKFYGETNENTVWELEQPRVNDLHPTMKPVELGVRAIKNSSIRNQIILDLFGGSGSTLIACEQLDRVCYMMEIDPKYVDVIVARWEKFTGKQASLIADH